MGTYRSQPHLKNKKIFIYSLFVSSYQQKIKRKKKSDPLDDSIRNEVDAGLHCVHIKQNLIYVRGNVQKACVPIRQSAVKKISLSALTFLSIPQPLSQLGNITTFSTLILVSTQKPSSNATASKIYSPLTLIQSIIG